MPTPQSSETEPGRRRSVGLRALIVDGNADTASSLALSLALDGLEPCIATSGAEALDRARSFRPEVVLIDTWLPDTNAQELVRQLRALPCTSNALLVAITDPGDVEGRQLADAAGCDAHLIRPFAFDRLTPLVQLAVERTAFLTRRN